MNTQSSEPLTLNPAFVYVEQEKENGYHKALSQVVEAIDSTLLHKFHSMTEKINEQYIDALRDIMNSVCSMMLTNNNWYQEEDERNEVYKYLCNFESHLDPERHKGPKNLADAACYDGPCKPDNY